MIAQYAPVFLTMFILIDPLGVAMVYLSLVQSNHLNLAQRRQVALKAPVIAFIVLTAFVLFGRQIIGSLGILPGSLYIAGGILLFIVSMDLLFAKPKRTTKASAGEDHEAEDHDGTEIAIFPLALPLLSGPGAITAILIFSTENAGNIQFFIAMLIIVALVLCLSALSMLAGDIILKIIGRTGVTVIERIMGILLGGMSVQFVYDGLVRLGLAA